MLRNKTMKKDIKDYMEPNHSIKLQKIIEEAPILKFKVAISEAERGKFIGSYNSIENL